MKRDRLFVNGLMRLAACALMAREGIIVNDLYSVVAPHIGEYICDDLTHPTDAGKAALVRAVADKIMEVTV